MGPHTQAWRQFACLSNELHSQDSEVPLRIATESARDVWSKLTTMVSAILSI